MSVRHLGLAMALVIAGCAASPTVRTYAVTSAAPPIMPAMQDRASEAAKPAPKPAEAPSLLGLYSRDIESLFGYPRFVRRDGPAQIWQYGTDACTLNLFLYREGAAFRVRHFEYRNRGADLVSPAGCDGANVSMALPKTP